MSVPPPPAPSAPPLPLECATASCTRVRRRHSLASSPPPFVLASPASASASASVPASPLRAELPRLPSHREAPVCPLRSDRLAVLASHLSCSSPMASEKESALATDPTGGATEEVVDSSLEFLILASDGLWDVVTNEEAAAMVKTILDAEQAAKRLLQEASERGSAVVHFLDQKNQPGRATNDKVS